jgi:hypothetical protein
MSPRSDSWQLEHSPDSKTAQTKANTEPKKR